MDQVNSEILNKMFCLSKKIHASLNQKGIAIPVKNEDGSITLGNFTIVKEHNFFSVRDYRNENVIERINLPQTAIILANGLALGKFIDKQLLQKDQNYGYALFEEKVYNRSLKKKNFEKTTLAEIKRTDARLKKDYYKKIIIERFMKLSKNI